MKSICLRLLFVKIRHLNFPLELPFSYISYLGEVHIWVALANEEIQSLKNSV